MEAGVGLGLADADSAPAAAAAAARLARALLWHGAGLSDTDPSVCLSVSQSAGLQGPVLPEAEPLPFNQVTGLRRGTLRAHEGKGRGPEPERQAASRGGWAPLRGWAAGRTTACCWWWGRRAQGPAPGKRQRPGARPEGLPSCRTWTGVTSQPAYLSFPVACSLPISLLPLVSGTTPPPVSVQVFSPNCV